MPTFRRSARHTITDADLTPHSKGAASFRHTRPTLMRSVYRIGIRQPVPARKSAAVFGSEI